MIFNIIFTVLLFVLVIIFFIFLRDLYNFKEAMNDIILRIFNDYGVIINSQKAINKEFKNRYDDILKIQKDINIIRNNFKMLFDEFKIKINNLVK